MTGSMNLAVPLKLDAFILNKDACAKDEKGSKIAPITKPNSTFLQLDDCLTQKDILNHVNLHNAFPAQTNPHAYKLEKEEVCRNHKGIYLHWVMPRFYRTGVAVTESAADQHTEEHREKGLGKTCANDSKDYSAVRAVPNRWLVIRKIDPDSIEPKTADIKTVHGWLVESDRVRTTDEDDLYGAVDIAPYNPTNNQSVGSIQPERQAEIFIGHKQSTNDWRELDNDDTDPETIDQGIQPMIYKIS
ncbi:hypothetical protein ASPWEDRAFT_175801 [Aspergillus wentii DTO 134E9]|uniref:Uncharacterized protein n=1 Tax=Aspergillus wentii DTO 134E9 TaxID=1073089 RepID=A0A1L9RC83_ASPWE|nr:uncharacterized protein ASPWEDRAFT_175801 [Aspergillus wentii DTO 134E9]KAI9935081.1 hypothetical protein MW887_000702 [Aspergillus wentii]OJJ32522.1 hypothetical protein ASPWEDRAFT_175801 [Aspergillus wentii DTO 134E9]